MSYRKYVCILAASVIPVTAIGYCVFFIIAPNPVWKEQHYNTFMLQLVQSYIVFLAFIRPLISMRTVHLLVASFISGSVLSIISSVAGYALTQANPLGCFMATIEHSFDSIRYFCVIFFAPILQGFWVINVLISIFIIVFVHIEKRLEVRDNAKRNV